jgi:site-specific DNA recombinase
MMVFNLINFAQFERKQTAERITANQLSRAKRGLWNGGTIPLGFDRNPQNPGQLVPNLKEAKDVETIFKTFLETGAVRKTCQAVTKMGIYSKAYVNKHGISKGGGAFTVPSLYQVLTNKAYVGVREINKRKSPGQIEEVKAAWEPVVSRKLFDQVQERLGANKHRYKPAEWKSYAYPLTEKIICGECGKHLGGKSANGHGGRYNYYAHSRQLHTDGKSHLKRCQIEKVRAERTEDMVIRFLKELLSRPEKIDEMVQAYERQSQTAIPGLDGRLKKLDIEIRTMTKRRENLVERVADLPPDVSADLFYEKIKDVTRKLESANVEKTELLVQKNRATGQLIDKEGLKRRLHGALARLDSIPKEKQREVFNNVIQFAEIHPMKLRLGLYAPTASITKAASGDTLGREIITAADFERNFSASSTSVKNGASEENRTPTP